MRCPSARRCGRPGGRGKEWLRQFGAGWEGDGQWLVDLVGELPPPSRDFSDARKVTGVRVHVRLKDGRSVNCELHVPMGAIGSEGRPPIAGVVRDKWLGTGGCAEFTDGIDRLEEPSADEVGRLLTLIFDDAP